MRRVTWISSSVSRNKIVKRFNGSCEFERCGREHFLDTISEPKLFHLAFVLGDRTHNHQGFIYYFYGRNFLILPSTFLWENKGTVCMRI